MRLTSTGAMIALTLLIVAQAVAPYGAWYAAVALLGWAFVSYAIDRITDPQPPVPAAPRPRCDHHDHDTEHDDE